MQYPLDLSFKLFALSQQLAIVDANRAPVMYVKQKMFKFKEHVQVFADSRQSQVLFDIKADRIIDFSASYSFTTSDGQPWGAVRRRGAKSLWSAHYEVIEDGRVDMTIQEENPWKKVLESMLGEIPIVGFIVLYLLNPSYIVARPSGEPLLRVTKRPSIFERHFIIHKLNDMPEDDELRALMGLIMLVLLERRRG